MRDGPVVLNNTPLVALWLLNRLELLRDLFGNVVIPTAVRTEFFAVNSADREEALLAAPWITVTALQSARQALVYTGLDEGEAAVLALAIEQNARLVVIDERRARRYAKRLKLPLTGSLGLLLLAKERGLVAEIAPLLERLTAAGLYLSPSLIELVQKMADEPTTDPS